MYEKALGYLKQMLGNDVEFRDGQWEAINFALNNRKTLIVQQTGWGKSIVYFIATKMLRDKGKGPTILISPLVALIRNQIESASNLGIVAGSINSQNVDEWDSVKTLLKDDHCDILLISPEQLANKERFRELMSYVSKGIGMFVVDEAHCISDWGHDFRPDYRRIINIIKSLPPNVPIMATTATANQRVIEDIANQLGDIEISRGPLVRKSLRIEAIKLKDQAERLAWLAQNVPLMPGVGIIYCLTVSDCIKVNKWLQLNEINSRAYYSNIKPPEEKINLENMFMRNKIKCLVATIALGMGYDKGDIGFVIHFQRPGNVVSYYQQIGRAGRKLDQAYAILLNGIEDDDIQEYFIRSAFPSQKEMAQVVSVIENSNYGLKQKTILTNINIRAGRLEKCLKYLEVENVISKDSENCYTRTVIPWTADIGKSISVTKHRYEELKEMQEFVETDSCYMDYIAKKLDDPNAKECGKCSNCSGKKFFQNDIDSTLIFEAIRFLKGEYIAIECRKQWPAGIKGISTKNMNSNERTEDGRALCNFGDAGWGKYIHDDKYKNNYFRDELVDASVELIQLWLSDKISSMNVAYVPSLNKPDLVKSFANRVAKKLGIPCLNLITKVVAARPQKELENSYYQSENAISSFSVTEECPHCNILLIDDIVDSKWTLTVCGYLLKQKGAELIYPFAIASAAGMRGDD